MKKVHFLFIIILLSSIILYSSCNKNNAKLEKIFNDAIKKVEIDKEISSNIVLPKAIDDVNISWTSSNPLIISDDGTVTLPDAETNVTLCATFVYNNEIRKKEYLVKVLSNSYVYTPMINKAITNTSKLLSGYIDTSIDLPTNYDDVLITWKVNDETILNNHISIENGEKILTLDLVGTFNLNNYKINEKFHLIIVDGGFFKVLTSAKELVKGLIEDRKLTEIPEKYEFLDISWSCDNCDNITADGKIIYDESSHTYNIKVIFSYGITSFEEDYEIIIPKINDEIIVKEAIKKLKMPESTKENLILPLAIDDVSITWTSLSKFYVTSEGIITRSDRDLKASLMATFTYNDYSEDVTYKFIILKLSDTELIELACKDVEIPKTTNINITLPLYLDYEVMVSWASSDESVIATDGTVTLDDDEHNVILYGTFILREEKIVKEYNVKVLKKPTAGSDVPHQKLIYATSFDANGMNNVTLLNNRLVLIDSALEGSYQSSIIETMDFESLVASWAATSALDATAELELKVRVNGQWSDFITYGEWGRGRENKCFDQNNNLIKLVEDEVSVKGSEAADAIIFKVTLRRSTLSTNSPALALVSFALENSSYYFPVDISSALQEKRYDVPKLNQNVVPDIGNSICSATTSTMLLKYKGEDFSSYDEYEHRYIAKIVREYNSKIFGNWVYNTVGMSSFGYISYVARMYSTDELINHLTNVGPIGLSVRGQMTSNEKNYYTQGHLIVCVGYRFENDKIIFLCNDPNVPAVYCEYSIDVIKKTWRNIAYVIL